MVTPLLPTVDTFSAKHFVRPWVVPASLAVRLLQKLWQKLWQAQKPSVIIKDEG